MRLGAAIPLYNRDMYIGAYLEQMRNHDIESVITLSTVPWDKPIHRESELPDRSEEIIRTYFPEVKIIKGEFRNPKEQWRIGISNLQHCDRILVQDCDIFLEEKYWAKMLEVLGQDFDVFAINFETMILEYYHDYRFGLEAIKGGYPPIFAVKPSQSLVNMVRAYGNYTKYAWDEPEIKFHHFRFSPKCSLVKEFWHEPSDGKDYKEAPKEIQDLILKWQTKLT